MVIVRHLHSGNDREVIIRMATEMKIKDRLTDYDSKLMYDAIIANNVETLSKNMQKEYENIKSKAGLSKS